MLRFLCCCDAVFSLGANTDLLDTYSDSALDKAVVQDYFEVAKALIEGRYDSRKLNNSVLY